MYKTIPTYNNNKWETTEFEDRESFIKFLLSIFKEPGEYNFTSMSKQFNSEAKINLAFIVINLLDLKTL